MLTVCFIIAVEKARGFPLAPSLACASGSAHATEPAILLFLSSSSIFVIITSVVSMRPAMLAAFVRAFRVTRTDDDEEPRLVEAQRERASERAGSTDYGYAHATWSTASASRCSAFASRMSVCVTARSTSASAGASDSSMTRASIRPL